MIVESPRKKAQQPPHIQSATQQVSGDSWTGSRSEIEAESGILEDPACDSIEKEKTLKDIRKKGTALSRQQNSNLNKTNFLMSQAEILTELLTIPNCTPVPALTQRVLLVVTTLSLMFGSDTIGTTYLLEARAMLLHIIALQECRLSDRSVSSINRPRSMKFLKDFVDTARYVLVSDSWRTSLLRPKLRCDLADLLDGRLFLNIVSQLQEPGVQYTFEPSLLLRFEALTSLLSGACGINLRFEPTTQRILPKLAGTTQGSSFNETIHTNRDKESAKSRNGHEVSAAVLPFSNPVFNAHLAPVHLAIDESATEKTTSRIFKELSHWHNHRRPIDQKAALAMTEWQKARAYRRNQLFMAEMRDYAASLTNAVGGVLDPETVIVTSSKGRAQRPTADSAETRDASGRFKPKKSSAQGGTKQGSKANVKDLAAAAALEGRDKSITKQIEAWNMKKAGFDREPNPASRFLMVKNYLDSLAKNKRAIVEAEVSTYLLSILVEIWITKCTTDERVHAMPIIVLIWNLILQIAKLNQGITAEIATCVANTVSALHIPALEPLPVQGKRSLSFQFVDFGSRKANLHIQLSPLEFQLVHAGPFLDRNMGSAPDSRVHDFEPDKWQRDVLDQIDAKNSVFVVAPTSAGKTFIS